ncbi:hypothetical protein F0256_06520 [Vibrio europaeus]|nr:hypothetical protein [Vibrio europaeus]
MGRTATRDSDSILHLGSKYWCTYLGDKPSYPYPGSQEVSHLQSRLSAAFLFFGELESWRAGELESWRAGELESWRAGEIVEG